MHLFNTESGLKRNHYILLTILHLLYLEYVTTGDQYAHCSSMLHSENIKLMSIFKETVFLKGNINFDLYINNKTVTASTNNIALSNTIKLPQTTILHVHASA